MKEKKMNHKQEILTKIGLYFLSENGNDYQKTEQLLLSMRITKVEIDIDEITITLGRPGLIIGPRGRSINGLIAALQTKIKIVEDTEDIYGYLIPYDSSEYY